MRSAAEHCATKPKLGCRFFEARNKMIRGEQSHNLIRQVEMKVLIYLNLLIVGTAGQCHICGNRGNSGITSPTGIVADTTCNEAVLDIWKKSLTATECRTEQQRYKSCCDGSLLATRPPGKPTIPKVTYEGPNPVCHLCLYKDYPSDPSHVIHLLYVGVDTCKNYYLAGLKGKIPARLCDPLRYFARAPCGCKTQTRSVMASPADTTLVVTGVVGGSVLFVIVLIICILICKK